MNKLTDSDCSEMWNTFISKGCKEAFSEIYYCHYDMLYYVGLKYTPDIQIVEDSIQNVFIYLLKNSHQLKPVSNVRGYLLKSFRRQLFLDLKKQKKILLSGQLTDNQFDYYYKTEQDSIEKDEFNELHRALKKSVCKLSAKQQEIIYLRFDCDLCYEEISSILEISVDSCYKSVYRSVKTIKEDMELMLVKSKSMFFWMLFRVKKHFP